MPSEQRLAQIFKALTLGIAFDLLASVLVGALLGLVLALIFLIQGIPGPELADHIDQAVVGGAWLVISVVTGGLISVTAGFVASHYLRFNIYPWLGLMGAVLALISFISVGADFSIPTAMGLSLITLCCVMLGGYLWEWSQR